MARHVRKGDMVAIIAGNDKGRNGKILRVIPKKDQVVVEGMNLVKRHVRPSRRNPQGGILEVERPIHISNVLPLNAKTGKPTRVKFKTEGGKKVRLSVTGDTL